MIFGAKIQIFEKFAVQTDFENYFWQKNSNEGDFQTLWLKLICMFSRRVLFQLRKSGLKKRCPFPFLKAFYLQRRLD